MILQNLGIEFNWLVSHVQTNLQYTILNDKSLFFAQIPQNNAFTQL